VEFKYFRPGGSTNAWLIRYYAEHVWQLPPPQVLLSISGGEDDYSLETSTQDALLFNMMEMTMKLDAWLITNGACTGFAKTVGAYRAKYAVTTPLIGICTAPPESEELNPARGGAPGVWPKVSGDSRGSLRGSAGWMEHIDAHLDRNHSHFILASNADKAAPQQLAQLRSKFESCVGQNHGWGAVQSAIHTTLLEHDVEWPEDLEPGGRQHASAMLPSRSRGLLSTVWAGSQLDRCHQCCIILVSCLDTCLRLRAWCMLLHAPCVMPHAPSSPGRMPSSPGRMLPRRVPSFQQRLQRRRRNGQAWATLPLGSSEGAGRVHEASHGRTDSRGAVCGRCSDPPPC